MGQSVPPTQAAYDGPGFGINCYSTQYNLKSPDTHNTFETRKESAYASMSSTNKALVPFLVGMMLLTGVCNTLLTKYQVRNNTPSPPPLLPDCVRCAALRLMQGPD